LITQILTNTPIWVFFIFVFLLIFGFMQTRTRTVSRIPALLLPGGMLALSLAGIYSSFGFMLLPIAAWGLGLVATAGIGYLLFKDKRISYDQQTQKFFVPGSWVPFGVILAIFFTKYVFAVMRAFSAAIIAEPAFIVALCMMYGIFSGYFASRAINLIDGLKRPSNSFKPKRRSGSVRLTLE